MSIRALALWVVLRDVCLEDLWWGQVKILMFPTAYRQVRPVRHDIVADGIFITRDRLGSAAMSCPVNVMEEVTL